MGLRAHRAILAARSNVLDAMLDTSSSWREAQQDVVRINASAPSLVAFLGFLYTARASAIPLEVAPEVLDLAAFHCLEPLVRHCGQFLARALRERRRAHGCRGTAGADGLVSACRRVADRHEATLGSHCALLQEVARFAHIDDA